MADAAEREKAEKLAAAKKRFEQLKKQKEKGKKGGEKAAEKKKEEDEPLPSENQSASVQDHETASTTETWGAADFPPLVEMEDVPEDQGTITDSATPSKPPHNRQPSLSLQSKLRSSSFRRTSIPATPISPTANGSKPLNLPALSPDGDAVTEIYRKQASRLDELEKENKKLSKEVEVAESRWRRTEEELEDLRENSGQIADLKARAEKTDTQAQELKKLKQELQSVQRHNSHLQSLTAKPRSTSTTSSSVSPTDLQAQLDSKSSTIESMEMEISNLRAELEKQAIYKESHDEQVSALEEKLDRAERAAGAAQREVLDLRKNLDRASEKAVKEGSERTSAETKMRSMSREVDIAAKNAEDSLKRVENLEKKLAALTTLHKESELRRQTSEKAEKEMADFRKRMVGVENENARLREERERLKQKNITGAGGEEAMDELEDEERVRLETRVRELEGEVFELRRGVWREKKKELAGFGEGDGTGISSPGGFDEVDLSGPMGPMRRQSVPRNRVALGGGGFAGVISNGFNAFTGGGGGGHTERESLDSLDGDDGFDEDAFRVAQEEEGRRRVERVKEVKRGLKDWEGWRMDLVDSRIGGGGAGEIFDV